MDEQWTCRHMSLSNPEDDGPEDLPLLLRRVADLMEEEGVRPMEVMDLTVSSDMTADGPWWTVTVYWSPDSGDEAGGGDEAGSGEDSRVTEEPAAGVEARRPGGTRGGSSVRVA